MTNKEPRMGVCEDGRIVSLLTIASYLECGEGRLVVALRRLAQNPAAIELTPGNWVSVYPIVMTGAGRSKVVEMPRRVDPGKP